MVRQAVIAIVVTCACIARPARAEPTAPQTWIGSNEYVGVVSAGNTWIALGAGLSIQERIGRLALGFEGEILRLDHDDHYGFAGQLAIAAGYELRIARGSGNEYFFVPELGVTTAVIYGAGVDHRTSNDVFAGARFVMRAWPDDVVSGPATARGISVHADLRVATNAVLFLLGYDWGM
jgi:hypothetical protein